MEVVVDASVLIDMHWGDLWDGFFSLPVVWSTTDLVADEVRGPSVAVLRARYGFRVDVISGAGVAEVARLMAVYRQPGFRDLSALYLAKHKRGCLATGDRHLRQAAEAEGLTCFGSLRILDDMVNLRLVVPGRAAEALTTMLAHRSRLPMGRCLDLLAKWAAM